MKKSEKIQIELNKLTDRVVLLKDSVHGQGNCSRNLIPKTIEGLNNLIKYYKDNYDIIG